MADERREDELSPRSPKCTCRAAERQDPIDHDPACPVFEAEYPQRNTASRSPSSPCRRERPMPDERREDELPPEPKCTCGAKATRVPLTGERKVIHSVICPLARDARSSDPNVGAARSLPRWASWATNDERHVVGFLDLPDGKTDPRLALFELRSRADAMFVVELLKRVGARPMSVPVEKLRELRIASEAVVEPEGGAR